MPPNAEQRRRADVIASSHVTASKMTWREDKGISKEVLLHKPGCLAGKPVFTMAEVATHNTREDCWVVIDNYVYNITSFIDRHPGGIGPITNMAGKDATDVFSNYHAARVYKDMLPKYLIGEVSDCPVYPHVADFRAVRQQLLKEGLFETDMTYYYKLGAFIASIFLTALALSLDLIGLGLGAGTFAAHMLGAALLGIFWQQLAGIGHDLGHSGISHDFHTDHKMGSQMALFMGLSLCWWKSDHNTHHVVCNAIEHDPNIQHMPVMAIHPSIFNNGPWWDTYHKKKVGMAWGARMLVSYQHWFFYPLMFIGARLFLRPTSFLANLRILLGSSSCSSAHW